MIEEDRLAVAAQELMVPAAEMAELSAAARSAGHPLSISELIALGADRFERLENDAQGGVGTYPRKRSWGWLRFWRLVD